MAAAGPRQNDFHRFYRRIERGIHNFQLSLPQRA